MQHKMQCERRRVIRQVVVDVEQEAVEDVLEDRPHEVAEEKRKRRLCQRRQGDGSRCEELERQNGILCKPRQCKGAKCELDNGAAEEVGGNGQPKRRDDKPLGSCRNLRSKGQ